MRAGAAAGTLVDLKLQDYTGLGAAAAKQKSGYNNTRLLNNVFLSKMMFYEVSLTEAREKLSKTLANLLGSKGADTVQSEAKHYPVLLTKSHVEAVVLHRNRATIPTVTEGRC